MSNNSPFNQWSQLSTKTRVTYQEVYYHQPDNHKELHDTLSALEWNSLMLDHN